MKGITMNLKLGVRNGQELIAERGAAMVEYALLLALIAIVAIGAVAAFGGSVGGEFSDIGSNVTSTLDERP
ncbi:MAG: Flp pilus assembly pilin Flp [Verrucomicrobiales bacterium]|jgi:Flp pilus assembly pilin Flp